MEYLPGLIIRVVLLLGVSVVLGVLANMLLPMRIAWIEDWSHYVEARAFHEQIALAERETVARICASGSHLVFDARLVEDYEAGHLPGAMPLPFESVDERFYQYEALLSPEQPVLTYCSGRDCDDALLLCIYLRNQGFTNVVLYLEGWEDWEAQQP
jgi:rhodanese-related sulfurtransferase